MKNVESDMRETRHLAFKNLCNISSVDEKKMSATAVGGLGKAVDVIRSSLTMGHC